MKLRNRKILACAAALGLAIAGTACDSDDSSGNTGNGGADVNGGGDGTTDPDGGTTDPDGGGTTDPDGTVKPDGVAEADNGTVDPDGGTPEPDGAVDPDGGTVDPDVTTGDPDADAATTPDVAEDTGTPEGCPKEEGTCTVELPEVFGPSFVLTYVQIGANGKPGEGLDVDDLGAEDCAPAGDCSDGIDNSASGLGQFANGPLADSVSGGDITLLGEASGDMAGTFTLNLYTGDPVDAACDPTATTCDYTVSDSSFGCDCELLVAFDNAMIDGDMMTAGGNDSVFAFQFPLSEGVILDVSAYRARIEATVDTSGGNLEITTGILGGALRKDDLASAIDAYPGEDIGGLPKSTIKLFLGSLQADVDTNDDGEDDAISIGLKLEGSSANITGMSPAE